MNRTREQVHWVLGKKHLSSLTPILEMENASDSPPRPGSANVAASGGGVEAPGPALTEADVAALERDLDELDALLQQTEVDLQQD